MRLLNDLKVLPWIAVAALGVAVVAIPSHNGAVYARMQEPDLGTAAVTPIDYAEFQDASLTGTTNTISATMVPVVTGSTTTYKDITIALSVSPAGVVTYVGEPTVVKSTVIQIANFKAGTYVGPSSLYGGADLITISGPGVTAGGATEWSSAVATGANSCTYPVAATWYVGSPTAPNNPLAARLKKAGITSTAYNYGILGGSGGCGDSNWESGSLIGASQTGNAITFVTYSNSGTTDSNTPREAITFTLK